MKKLLKNLERRIVENYIEKKIYKLKKEMREADTMTERVKFYNSIEAHVNVLNDLDK